MENQRLTDRAPLGWKVAKMKNGYECDEHADGDRGVFYAHDEGHSYRADHADQRRVPGEVFECGTEIRRARQVQRQTGQVDAEIGE